MVGSDILDNAFGSVNGNRDVIAGESVAVNVEGLATRGVSFIGAQTQDTGEGLHLVTLSTVIATSSKCVFRESGIASRHLDEGFIVLSRNDISDQSSDVIVGI